MKNSLPGQRFRNLFGRYFHCDLHLKIHKTGIKIIVLKLVRKLVSKEKYLGRYYKLINEKFREKIFSLYLFFFKSMKLRDDL